MKFHKSATGESSSDKCGWTDKNVEADTGFFDQIILRKRRLRLGFRPKPFDDVVSTVEILTI